MLVMHGINGLANMSIKIFHPFEPCAPHLMQSPFKQMNSNKLRMSNSSWDIRPTLQLAWTECPAGFIHGPYCPVNHMAAGDKADDRSSGNSHGNAHP